MSEVPPPGHAVVCWVIHEAGTVVAHGYCDAAALGMQPVPPGTARLEIPRAAFEAVRMRPMAYQVVDGEIVLREPPGGPPASEPPWAG